MLPDFLVSNFEIASAMNSKENLRPSFEEKAKPPQQFNTVELVCKGFLGEITLQDFQLGGSLSFYMLNAVDGQTKSLEKSSKETVIALVDFSESTPRNSKDNLKNISVLLALANPQDMRINRLFTDQV